MLDSNPTNKIIFLDIETTSQYPSYAEMPPRLQKLFEKRFKKQIEEGRHAINREAVDETNTMEEMYNSRGPLHPEWGRILCISFGTVKAAGADPNGPLEMEMHSCADQDETKLLKSFIAKTASLSDKLLPSHHFCTHAGKLFDYPFIAKRIILNQLPLPRIWDYSHLKPWETPYFIDTNETWKHGIYDAGTSLDMLAALFNVASPKDDMDGSMVKDVYYKEKNLQRIVKYCEADVYALAQVYLRIKNIKNEIILITK